MSMLRVWSNTAVPATSNDVSWGRAGMNSSSLISLSTSVRNILLSLSVLSAAGAISAALRLLLQR